jgi:predicted type IV restriction endonuclease
MFPQLNLPPAELKLSKSTAFVSVWCVLRRKNLVLTPEEWVRQHCIHYLLSHKGFLQGRLASEFPLKINGHVRRCDLLYFDSEGKPLLLIECKSTDITIDEKTFLQTSNYVASTGARYFWMTNGLEHIIADCANGITYLESLPDIN